MVLNNVAMFVENPNAMPYYLTIGTGTTSVQDTAGTKNVFNWDLFSNMGKATLWYFDKSSAELDLQNQSQDQWSSAAVLNPDELILMRCVYQKVVARPACDCDQKLMQFFGKKPGFMEAMRPGWYSIGCKHDVPKCAVAVGHCGKTYVWVMPENLDYLTRLTLAILDIATIQPTAIGEKVTPPDPNVARIKEDEEHAKALAEVLHNYPPPASGEFEAAKVTLDNVLRDLDARLAVKYPLKVEEKTAALDAEIKSLNEHYNAIRAANVPEQEKRRIFESLEAKRAARKLLQDIQTEADAIRKREAARPTAPAEEPLFQPRKPLYLSNQPLIIPPIPIP
jgi:hypothetical protein